MSIKQNYHCCVLSYNGKGIVIEGKSGAGKTSLLMSLLEHSDTKGLKSYFVCDDQAILEERESSVIANAPDTIAGKIEIFGFGIIEHDYLPSTKIDLVVRLVSEEVLERMPENKLTSLLSIIVPLIEVPERHEAQSVRIIEAYIHKMNSDSG